MSPRSYHVVLNVDGEMVGGERYDEHDASTTALDWNVEHQDSREHPHRPAELIEKLPGQVVLSAEQVEELYRQCLAAVEADEGNYEDAEYWKGRREKLEEVLLVLNLLDSFRDRIWIEVNV